MTVPGGASRSCSPNPCRVRLIVFLTSIGRMSRSTPLGDGAMNEATRTASSKETSPTFRRPLGRDASGTLPLPRSITTAPGLSHEPRTVFGLPSEETTMSASLTTLAMSAVNEWQMVTVALLWRRSCATGEPTVFERPMTTARRPCIGRLKRQSTSSAPIAVVGTASGFPTFRHISLKLTSDMPSASFSGASAPSTRETSTSSASGSCTLTACTSGSPLSSAMAATMAAVPLPDGRARSATRSAGASSWSTRIADCT
mmetsp:Transcript_12052/g.31526  ORF Transcript_12052/g.31526 Transcript_12052/m.31526 type:complete len:257 (+) Transcript_12052:284-1054(+)